MADFLRRTPMLWLFLPQVIIILISHYTGSPLRLYKDTDISFPDSMQTYRAVLHDYPKERRKTMLYTAEVLPDRHKVLLYLLKDSSRILPSYLDTIWVKTTWKQPEKIGAFDYAAYLRREGIAATGYANSRHWQTQGKADTTLFSFERLRHRLIRRLETRLTDREAGTVAAMTLGYKHNMDDDLRQSFQRSGAAHVLAVSGLHTGLIYTVLIWLLTLGGLYPPLYDERWRQVVQGAVIIAGLAFYAALTGFSPSVCRAAVMFSLAQIAIMVRRQPFSFNTLFAAAFLILCFRPRNLFSVSFQLSFAAVAGILALEPVLSRLFPITTPGIRLKKTLSYIRSLFTVSLAAQISTLPISLYYFSQTSNIFLLTNIVVLPLVSLLVMFTFAYFLLYYIPYIGDITATVLGKLTDTLNSYVTYMEHLPHAFTEAVLTLPQMIALYVIIIFFIWILRRTTQNSIR